MDGGASNMNRKLHAAGSVTVYALLVFSIVMGLYMMGYNSIYANYVEQQDDVQLEGNETNYSYNTSEGGMDKQQNLAETIVNVIIESMKDPKLLFPLLGVGLVSFVTAGGTRYALTFIIPAIILLAILNIFVLPMGFLYDEGIPQIIQIFVGGFLNLILMLTVVEFISGRQ